MWDIKIKGIRTVTDWLSFLRHLCTEDAFNVDNRLGGDWHIVEIDESTFAKRKYVKTRK